MEINNNKKSIIYNSLTVTMILLIAMLFCFGNYVVFAKGILNDNKIYEIKNPNSNCSNHSNHSNYDYFLGDGKMLFKTDGEKHIHYYGVRDVETDEIVLIREIKYRDAKKEEWEESDTGYRCKSIKYYDKDKKLVYTLLNDTDNSDFDYLYKDDIVYKNSLIMKGHRICINIKTGMEDKIALEKFKEYEEINNKNKSDSNKNTYNPISSSNASTDNDVKNKKEKFSFKYNNGSISGFKINEKYIAFADDKTFILNKNNELIKEILEPYEDVNIITDSSENIILYVFLHEKDNFYYDVYDDNFNIVFKKIESWFYLNECDYIGINKKDSGIYEEGSWHDGLYTTLYDKNLKLVKKFDDLKSVSISQRYKGKECFFVDDYGFDIEGRNDDDLQREIYDLDFKLIRDNIYDMFAVKNKKTNDIYYFITEKKSTKVYNENYDLVKDLNCRILNSHREGYTFSEYIFKYRGFYDKSYYYSRGIYPIIFLKDMVFIRLDKGAKVLDDKFNTKVEGYKEFIDFNEEYFSFYKDKSYGLMDYNLNVLAEFDIGER